MIGAGLFAVSDSGKNALRKGCKGRKEEVRAKRTTAFKTATGHTQIPHLDHAPQRLIQYTVTFIHWLKDHLDLERDWSVSLARLRRGYQHL